MQVSGGSIGATCSAVAADGGVLAFWNGLPFAWGREMSYTSVKLGACEYYLFLRLFVDCSMCVMDWL